ncbi:EscU/YscU/HrcU family type III secretion system export apparatus switch protein [Natranaerobius thermophilus]|uniref:Flagellar biosynthesis protein n=1 Tax=Natranaerobius thermophilus (strain ATCC BAA-1301 / DSM 18059 / JW/NM-WN-LF) TaxID=457570 RepID=B2A0P6_NATTJ|nr:EscU/YscU/HrcU family type III secretion system export apparatus switch protein [Natranaerobius thermophilus]ACB85926.1 flagellar biosynthesis protein [Natranaerobius thermophilus JW/NM-WN-LF]
MARKPKHFKRAAALKYDQDKNQAPQLIAAGQGLVADEIIRRAEEEGIYIYQDPELANTLSQLSLYQEIPEELYQGVAEVLAFIQRIDRDSGNSPRD